MRACMTLLHRSSRNANGLRPHCANPLESTGKRSNLPGACHIINHTPTVENPPIMISLGREFNTSQVMGGMNLPQNYGIRWYWKPILWGIWPNTPGRMTFEKHTLENAAFPPGSVNTGLKLVMERSIGYSILL